MSLPQLTAVFSSDALGGSELFNLEFLRTIHARGVRTHAIVPGKGELNDALGDFAESIQTIAIPTRLTSMSRFQSHIDIRMLPRRMWALGGYLPALGRALATLPGPVCSLGFRSQLAVAGVLPRGRSGIWVVHEVVPPGAPARMWRAASWRASRILTYSEAAASQRALGGRGATVHTVRFDLSRFATVGEIGRVRTIGLVGDLVELKNHLLAVQLAQRLRDRGEEVLVLLVGRDVSENVPRAADYAQRVRRAAEITPGVELISSAPEAMPEVMARLDVLLHLSTVPESFGRVCVEAMAAGRPVVAYDHGGVSELVQDRRTGFLCPAGDPDAVARALLMLIQDRQLATDMGRAGRTSALERFDQRSDRRDTVGDALADYAIAEQ